MTDCDLCEPTQHENEEAHTQLWIQDPVDGMEGSVDLCLEHYRAAKRAIDDE